MYKSILIKKTYWKYGKNNKEKGKKEKIIFDKI